MITTVTIVGSGRLGTTLAAALAAAGCAVNVVHHDRLPASLPVSGVVILAVPDGAIASMAQVLAGTGSLRADTLVVHCAGAVPRGALDACRAAGAATAALHPFQMIRAGASADVLRGIPWGMDADGEGTGRCRALVDLLGGTVVPLDGTDRQRALYHAAAVAACNVVQSTVALAADLARAAGLDPAVLLPAIVGTTASETLAAVDGGHAVPTTGPVARGDAATVRRHVEALPPAAADVYRALSAAMLMMGAETVPDAGRRALQDVLRPMPAPVHKALVYALRQTEAGGWAVLVFAQPHAPEAGLQVPKGTMGTMEDATTAALRELEEEAGIVAPAATAVATEWLPDDGVHVHSFAVVLDGADASFDHRVTGGGEDDGIRYAFTWMDTGQARTALTGYMGRWLDQAVAGLTPARPSGR